jgi:hypothetical protein
MARRADTGKSRKSSSALPRNYKLFTSAIIQNIVFIGTLEFAIKIIAIEGHLTGT